MAYQPSWVFNAKAILEEEQLWYYLTHSWMKKEFHTSSKDISPKVNVIARLEFELGYYEAAVKPLRHGLSLVSWNHITVSKKWLTQKKTPEIVTWNHIIINIR